MFSTPAKARKSMSHVGFFQSFRLTTQCSTNITLVRDMFSLLKIIGVS